MILKYKFVYQSNNNSFIGIIDNILKQKETKYSINKEMDDIFLYVEDEEDRLIKISDELSNELPVSMFLKDFALEVVSQVPHKDYQYTLDSYQKSYCSNCLAEIENKEMTNYYNPFINCHVCGTTSNVKSIEIYQSDKKLEFKENLVLFEFLALDLSNGKKIKIQNSNKEFVIKKLDNLEYKNQRIICNNIESLSKITVGSKHKNILLLSFEKPIIEFNINSVYKKNHNLDFDKVSVSSPWDLFFYILSKELLKLDVEFLTVEENIESYDLEVKYDTTANPPKIAVTENNIFMLQNSNYEKRLDDVYKKFNEPSKSQFMVLLDENKLYEKSILNFYISSKNDDGISLYSSKIDGVVDIFKFKMPSSVKDLFEEIEKTENGDKLLNSYKQKFPASYEKALNTTFSDTNASITFLWKLASTVLDLGDIYENAKLALLQKGPRIDYKLKNSDKLFNKEFELVSLIKSGISFKLAGVDEKTLSLGYVESFVDFICDLYDEVNEQFQLDGASFCGDYIGEEFINKLIAKSFNRSAKLYYNKDFPIQL